MSKNSNCLEDSFEIGASSVVTVTDDGTDSYNSDVEWAGDSWCRCSSCGHDGVVGDFRGAISNPQLTPVQKMVLRHYNDGEFLHLQNMKDVEKAGDTLLLFMLREAGDVAGNDNDTKAVAEYIQALTSASGQLLHVFAEIVNEQRCLANEYEGSKPG